MSIHQTNFHVRMPRNYQCMITLFEITSFVDNMQRENRNKMVTRLLPTIIWHKQFFDILQFLRERELCITNFTRVVFPHSYIQHNDLSRQQDQRTYMKIQCCTCRLFYVGQHTHFGASCTSRFNVIANILETSMLTFLDT